MLADAGAYGGGGCDGCSGREFAEDRAVEGAGVRFCCHEGKYGQVFRYRVRT